MPEDPAALESWKADYQKMLESFIYEENPLPFEDLLEKMNRLLENIRRIQINDEFFNDDQVK